MCDAKDYTILVVDDDEMLLEVTAELLEEEGYRVLVAENGHKAISICRNQDVHLMVLDYMMPEVTGEDVVRAVRTFDSDLQILLQTGHTEIPPRRMLQTLAIQGYHSKAEGPEKLLMWVDVALKSYTHLKSYRMLENSLLILGLALEARHLETAGHTQRVVQLAEALGRTFGLSGKRLESLRQGAYLHDLGKLCVPDTILLKPGPLNQQEWIIVEAHAQQGFDLAAHIPGLDPDALAVIRHHHERWDGAGYPVGLIGAEIPLPARIFAICDVYDALVSARPYKPAWSPAQTEQELVRQQGRHFDPEVVEAFLALDRVERQAAALVDNKKTGPCPSFSLHRRGDEALLKAIAS